MYFKNRIQAAELLVDELSQYRSECPLVLGIPRGAVPMAQYIADQLGGNLDVALVHKIGAPGNPEFAIGSISEFGSAFRSEAVDLYGISDEYFNQAAQDELRKLKERRNRYSPVRSPISPKGRVVILVDDGIATGATMLAAVRAIRAQGPKQIVVAAPVASPDAVHALRPEADEVVVLDTPEDFFSISQFYESFEQVTDEEVIRALMESRGRKTYAAA